MNPGSVGVHFFVLYVEARQPGGRCFSSEWVGAQKHTLSLAAPLRGRTPVPGFIDGYFKTTIRALSCPFGGRMLLRPTLTVEKTRSYFELLRGRSTLNTFVF